MRQYATLILYFLVLPCSTAWLANHFLIFSHGNEVMQEKVKHIPKRTFQVPSGKVLTGEGLASTIMGAQDKIAEAYTYTTGYQYVKLDLRKVGQITYENYFIRWCDSSVIAGFTEQLKIKVGGQWKE